MHFVKLGLTFLISTTVALAAVAQSTQTTGNDIRRNKPGVRRPVVGKSTATIETSLYSFNGGLQVVRSTSLYDLKNGSKYDGMDYLTEFGFATPIGAFSTKLSVTQVLSPTEEDATILNDSNLTYAYTGIKLKDDPNQFVIGLTPALTAIIPLSKKAKNIDQLITALIGSVTLGFAAGKNTNLAGLSLGLTLTLGQNFYQKETDVNGSILNKNSSNQIISVAYELSHFTFSLSYANQVRVPYAGDLRNAYEFSQDIGFKFAKDWVVSIGHTNAGATLKPNGYESNVSIVNEDNSIAYLALSYGFGGAL
jgi:hypothetical protein